MMHKWQTARGNKPNIVPAIVSTHPMDVFCKLILVEGDIPGQQGLRILPVATVHWVRVCGRGGFGGYKGDVMFLRVRGWRWLCVYSVYAQQSDASGLYSAIPRLKCCHGSCLVNWLLFWAPCRRHRCLSELSAPPSNPLFQPVSDCGVRGIRVRLGMLHPLYSITTRELNSNLAITLKRTRRLL